MDLHVHHDRRINLLPGARVLPILLLVDLLLRQPVELVRAGHRNSQPLHSLPSAYRMVTTPRECFGQPYYCRHYVDLAQYFLLGSIGAIFTNVHLADFGDSVGRFYVFVLVFDYCLLVCKCLLRLGRQFQAL